MSPIARAQRIRDSPRATALAVTAVVVSQVPVTTAFAPQIPSPLRTWEGLAAAWVVAATAWTLYAFVHLLAPLADVLDHPDRSEWGPFATVNVYTYRSLEQLGIRLLHGVLGFWVVLSGVVVFVATEPLLILPVSVGPVVVLLLSAHIGTKTPPQVRDPERHD